jgi:hypothetical protein
MLKSHLMHETVLRDYFIGRKDETELSADLQGTVVQTSYDVFTHTIISGGEEQFSVTPEHLAKLCDSVLSSGLQASDLEVIGFCLATSDCFVWDTDNEAGRRVSETVNDWASPEINYPLTIETARKFRERLITGKDTFTRVDSQK